MNQDQGVYESLTQKKEGIHDISGIRLRIRQVQLIFLEN